MSDITKCRGTNCPKKDTCYRYTAKDNEYWQSFSSDCPWDKDLGTCEEYWRNYNEDD